MKKWKKAAPALMMMCMLFTALPMTAFAKDIKTSYSASTSGKGTSIKVRQITYDPSTKSKLAELDVKFPQRVTWKRTARVTSAKDDKGTSYNAYLRDKDSDDCEIAIEGMKDGHTYTIVIDGIKKRGSGDFRKLTLKVKIPAANKDSKVKIRKVQVDDDNDDDDRYQTKIDIKFASKVVWNHSSKVSSVKDSQGNTYQGQLIDRDDDECEVYIKNIKYGRTYTIKISGVKARGASSYETVSVNVKVPGRTQSLQVKETDYDIDYDDMDYYEDEVTGYSVEFKFNKNVLSKNNSYVIVTDASGTEYSTQASYVEWEDDECKVYLSRELEYGDTYRYEIAHVKAVGDNSYTTLKGTFVAR